MRFRLSGMGQDDIMSLPVHPHPACYCTWVHGVVNTVCMFWSSEIVDVSRRIISEVGVYVGLRE